MKKIIILLLLLALAVDSLNISAADMHKVTDAHTLISALTDALPQPSDNNVTRGEFVVTLEKLLLGGIGFENGDSPFGDINAENGELSAALTMAVSQGVVGNDTSFYRPDDAITFDEALKMLDCALGYEPAARLCGGWPTGYRAVAISNSLTENLNKITGTVTASEALLLFENFLTAPMLETVYKQNGSTYEKSEKNILESVYNAYEISGIVAGNEFTLIGQQNKKVSECRLTIDNTELIPMSDMNDFLGKNVRAWCCETDGENYCLSIRERSNKTVKLNLFHADAESANSVYDSEEEKSYKITKGADVIYNGRFINTDFMQLAGRSKGEAELIDSNTDGVYDTIKICEPDYMLVDFVDTINRKIYDKYDSTRLLDLSDDSCAYYVHDLVSGNELSIGDIEQGDIIGVVKSADGLYVRLYKNLPEISGKVDALTEDEKTEISGMQYDISSYCNKHYSSALSLGSSADFTVGICGEIVLPVIGKAGYKFAYVINAALSGKLKKTLQFKLFDISGNISVLDSSEVFFMNGKKYTDVSKAYDELCLTADEGQTVSQLIRYLSEDGKTVRKIDTASEATDLYDASRFSADDTLVKYNFRTRYRYRHYGNLFYPGFNAVGTKFFKVPSDRADEEKYKIIDRTYFGDGTYAVTPYNVGVNGAAEVAVYITDVSSGLTNITGDTPCLVVEKIVQTKDKDGYYRPMVKGWTKGQFVEYFLDENIKIDKASGDNTLKFGDIVFYSLIEDEISDIVVVFDGDKTVFAPNIPTYFGAEWSTVSFLKGKVYASGDGYIYCSNIIDEKGKYDYSLNKLTHITAITNDVVIADMKTGELRAGKTSELLGYINAGDNADYIVLQYSYLYGYLLTVYRGVE